MMCEQAISNGAVATAGGTAINKPGDFLHPTVLTNVRADMTVAQEEIFGPVISAIKFKHDDEAIQIANDTDTRIMV